MKKIISYLVFSTMLFVSFTSCEDLNVENINQADRERALAEDSDVISLLDGATTNVFAHIIGFSGIYMDNLADQSTTTNAYVSFWSFANQPREQINNSPTNADLGNHVGNSWGSLNSYINSANTIITLIEIDGKQLFNEGVDVTNQKLSAAYFVKGLAQGYLSLIYDKAFIVNPDTDLSALEFSTYQEVMAASITNLEKSVQLAGNSATLRLHDSYTLPNALYKQVANSFMAKITIGNARTKAEAANTDKAKVLAYVNAGITADFTPPTKQSVLFNNLQDWRTFFISGQGYLPTDIKVMHFLDSNYPVDYPTDPNIILDPVQSNDPRVDYFEYNSAFGFLRESRGRYLFTNYFNVRKFSGNNRNVEGIPLDIFTLAELQYIKAEVSSPADAAAILDASPRGTVGNITTPGTATEVEKALLYEYSVELDLNASIGTHWFYMRRNDMLQEGTPLHYPIPASELEIIGEEFYTFGGTANIGSEGTASGANSWKNF
ncbi:RagB/SusD family nutrient uptake outer membrane protein [Polaribacter haliotis]|uniref:RagB/SusD family nutrient uptake outer membrane protein n=1 Tax=Polaribacter haliotis TaxID=1888915 RepID=A0A7L8AKG1_9FLAO|nr:RagB/SusD family nutrient uptake outer membrane protein [Polaribacter haliotis]QOD62279.1 RagB/SusD family nutrient uptake outer membrane protein [Polaribacter haliotis]